MVCVTEWGQVREERERRERETEGRRDGGRRERDGQRETHTHRGIWTF